MRFFEKEENLLKIGAGLQLCAEQWKRAGEKDFEYEEGEFISFPCDEYDIIDFTREPCDGKYFGLDLKSACDYYGDEYVEEFCNKALTSYLWKLHNK